MEKGQVKTPESTRQEYAKPVLTRHGKLKNITEARVGSLKDVAPLGCTRLFV
ncbi:MAG: hypothetical protein JRK53_13755 [Deltaproteobacteria bacterium]|nr:hypothetical protein [Deltaproteobacteria bacterium]MBW1819073.1 hypothetical protein [Deltaproteobacteria bacterium]MBW2285345.1 hypothetical protein [Deltaproteobacteria bacterium]